MENSTVKELPKKRGGDTGNGFDKRKEDINLEGAPEKDFRWKEIFMKQVEVDSIKRLGYKRKESMAIAQIEKAEEGDTGAFREIADRMEGRSKQGVEVGGTGEDGKIEISITMV